MTIVASSPNASMAARDYALRYGAAYTRKQPPPRSGEIKQFRAMSDSLVAASTGAVQVTSHEYHGGRYQVRFVGQGGYSRPNARCELSDLAVISYNPRYRLARLTYIQAKYERPKMSCCEGDPGSLAANLEQWDLLGRRPKLAGGVGKFSPPSDLLSSAVCDSVGTFVFFVEYSCSCVGLAYSVAKDLAPVGAQPTRYGRVQTPAVVPHLAASGELRSGWGHDVFAAGMADLRIGTPICTQATAASGLDPWLAAQLRAAAQQEEANAGFIAQAETVAEILDDASPRTGTAMPPGIGARRLILMQTSSIPEERE